MSSRSRASRARQHVHCDSCYSRRCRAQVEPSVCCALIPCRLHCGALFHLCKEEEHLLLCPNARVSCLNADYGCLFQMPRSSRAAHLQVCPASVVCCSMEWLRWPTDDTYPHGFRALQNNVLEEAGAKGDALDVALTLVDQSDLYERLKMKPLYPELMEKEDEETKDAEGKVDQGEVGVVAVTKQPHLDAEVGPPEKSLPCDVGPVEVVSQTLAVNQEKLSLIEKMFSMERGGCTAAQEKLENQHQNPASGAEVVNQSVTDLEKKNKQKDNASASHTNTGVESSAADCCSDLHDITKTGQAPWQEGVLDRLGHELTPQEYNMYMVHHGRMLLAFGQIEACTPREKDFVYGSLEPIPVQTLRSFKVPESYHYRQRVHKYDTTARPPTVHCSVDTSDLKVGDDAWYTDEASATLLGYAEQAVMGHKISETKGADGLYVDTGTQTYTFRSAPFRAKTSLADVMTDRPLKLYLQLQAESVNSRNNRASCAFTFICGHTFHRREFANHVRNVHCDIQTSLSGWFEQRCPLSYLGCTYCQRRFQPSAQAATVVYNQELKCFNVRPTLQMISSSKPTVSSLTSQKNGEQNAEAEDSLSSLPYEVLCHMATFLDSLSLYQLALVSRLMRQVCFSLLHERGMVTFQWERKTHQHGGSKWKAKRVWQFSHLFSPIDSWSMTDVAPMSTHLKVCPYYEMSMQSEPVLLPGLREEEKKNQMNLTLVNHFTGKKKQH